MGLFKRLKQIRADFLDVGQPRQLQKFNDLKGPFDEAGDQDYEKLHHLYHTNGIAYKIVSKPAEDATRNGWRLVIPKDPNKQAVYQQALDMLDLKQVLARQLIYRSLDGDGYIAINVKEKDSTDSKAPINTDNVVNVASVHAFGQTHVTKTYTNNDPTSDDYGKEAAVEVTQTQSGSKFNANGVSAQNMSEVKTHPVIIDESRCGHISLDKMEDDLTGMSIISRCWDQIHVLDQALEASGKILREYEIKVFNSDAYFDMGDAEKQKMRAGLEWGMDNESVVMLSSQEKMEKLSSNLSGIDSLLSFAWQNLAAASNIPKSVLTGEQAGTLAGGTQDVANYYDGIKAIQEELLRPELEKIVKLLMYSSGVGDGSEDPDGIEWHIEFNPLWSPDDKTMSETTANYAGVAVNGYNAGILSLDEAKAMLFGQSNNQIQGMQNIAGDSLDSLTSKQIDEFEKHLKQVAQHGKTKNS